MFVLVVFDNFVLRIFEVVYVNFGYGSWEIMYKLIRLRCYFFGIGSSCCDYVKVCVVCNVVNLRYGLSVLSIRIVVLGRLWNEVVMDTLELGVDRSG